MNQLINQTDNRTKRSRCETTDNVYRNVGNLSISTVRAVVASILVGPRRETWRIGRESTAWKFQRIIEEIAPLGYGTRRNNFIA